MDDAHAKECRAREAESLEQAKQANHEDLKHLHETIAQQWRLLAKVIETGRAHTRPPIGNGRDILTLEAKSDATPDSPDARRLEHLDDQILETDDLVEQISSGTGEEYPDQILENDRCVATVSPDAKDVRALDDQVSEIGHGATQISAGAQGIASLGGQISEMTHSDLPFSADRTGIEKSG